MIWWDQWELTSWNSLLAPCLKNLFGTLSTVYLFATELFLTEIIINYFAHGHNEYRPTVFLQH